MKASFMVANENIPEGSRVTGLTGRLQETLRELSSIGFKKYELMIDDPEKVDIERIKRYNDSFGLNMIFLCSGEMAGIAGLSLNNIDENERKKAIEKFLKAIEVANEFGVNINIGRLRGTIWEDGKEESLKRLAKSLEIVDEFIDSESMRVEVLIEPLRKDICPLLNGCEETVAFIEKNNLRNFKILLDSDHLNKESDPEFIRRNTNWIKHVHLADTAHEPLGRGEINFDEFMDLLLRSGYEGEFSVEVFCGEEQYKTLKESYEYLKKYSNSKETDNE